MSIITEIGCMGVKPGLNIMDETTPEGQVLPRAWKSATTTPGGPHKIYWGLEIEDPSNLWAFFDWDSIEAHEKFAKEFGGEVVKDFSTILTHGDQEFTKHIATTPSPPSVLQSAVTEVMIAYFPSDISQAGKDTATTLLQQFVENGINKSPNSRGASYG